MANYLLCLAIFRIALPIFMSVCITFRPTGLSAIYLLLLYYFPFVPVPTEKSMAGHTGIYLKILIVISAITGLGQIAFQIVLASMPPYGHFLKDCEFLEKVLRHAGFVRLNSISTKIGFTWITPELLMLVISITVFKVLSQLTARRESTEVTENGEGSDPQKKIKAKTKYLGILVAVGRYAVLLTLCLAAVLRPSVLGGLYFIIFLSAATWWSCYKQLRRGFAILLRVLAPVVLLHMSVLYAYQLQWPQELLERNSTYARYFGLTPILSVDCDADPRDFIWSKEEWATYVNPVILYLLYYVLVLESAGLLTPESQKKQGPFSRLEGSFSGQLGRQMSQRLSRKQLMRAGTTKMRWQSATRKVRVRASEKAQPGETTPLIRGVSPSSRKYGSGKKAPILQDSTGSVTITGENTEDIQMQELEDEYKPTVFENIIYGMESVLQVIIKSSYIGTNIIMMAWSITYLSWITFVLLIWANLLWLVPNQRKSMLRSSPFLVLYAWFLLISAYIYSMNLTEQELPSTVQGINLAQIGFVKVKELPCNPLLVKCLFTVMFWITLRQYMQERVAERQSHALADMVAPLQISVGTATGVNNEQEKKGNKLMEKIGRVINKFLTKFWIWVVAITLFAVAITGQRMTGFRVIYMALFLFFIISFQLSFSLWRRIMFGFWLTVIVYSMIILVMVYTYQFDNFPEYWRDYLHVPMQQQLDIGLERFETKQLFVRLVTPTFFVIITVIQLHYFHKDFMEISDPKNTSVIGTDNDTDLDQSSLQGGAAVDGTSEKDATTTTSLKFDLTDIEHITTQHFRNACERWLKRLVRVMNLTFLFLELHMPKIVLFFAMLLCVYDKCALYMVVIILIVLSFILGRPMQIFAIYTTSVLVSVLLISRMIYQIQYIEPSEWNITCEQTDGNTTKEIIENNAKWLGFQKSDDSRSLPSLVKWNIIYILVVTLWAVILVRQYNYRISRGKPTTRAFFMFPKITRSDADKNLRNCLKYLANYGFYKFGVEISLMATVGLIGFRMDMYAIIYSIWLCILFSLSRPALSRIWNFYMMFIAIFLPIQYFMAVGLPPTLCINFPWNDNEILRRLQEWAYLLDEDYPPSAKKLICDFILLLFVSRQSVVFRIEKRYEGQNYAGGSNDSIIHFAEDKRFQNPVPDFITYVRSYLDIFKRGIFMGFLWVTLALVFLAGTNRVNIFSIGYLIGAFVFLWHGSDLYLRPIPKILKAWNWLLGYNVAVIFIKSMLQILGCVFIQEIPTSTCWTIQLFGIGCVKKFGNIADEVGFEENVEECKVPREFIGLVWDGLCFGFLIMQKRIFQSYNFFHMVDETKATTILASRGAELIEELRQKRMLEQEEQERRVLEKIKAKMDRIKANQQKIQGTSYKDASSHFVAIRSGDYYMFDELEDDEIDLTPEEDLDQDDEAPPKKPGVGELLSSALKTDIGQTVRRSDVDLKRRSSMPLSRQRSAISARSQLSAPLSAPPTIEEHSPRSVTIKERSEEDEPQPGTSKDEDISELSPPGKYTLGQKILDYILFACAFIESSMISFTNFLNKYSKDYRYVIRVLTKEKKVLKEKTTYNVGLRVGSGQMWQPAGSYHDLLRQSVAPSESHMTALEDYEAEMSSYDQPTIVRLLLAIWFIIMSRSELLCYFIIFLNQIKSATFLSLPLPIMVFVWGTLTIPRPSKTFWVTIIAYTEVIVLIKCMFQFEIIPWNQNQAIINNPFYPPRIIGIERKKNYAVWDLLLLLVVFFHRFMLKSMGLWRTTILVPAVMLSDGEYKIDSDGQLQPLDASHSSRKYVLKSKKHRKRQRGIISREGCNVTFLTWKRPKSGSRKSSDLQRLVDEDGLEEEIGQDENDYLHNKVVSLHSEEVAVGDHFPRAFQLATSQYTEQLRIFFQQLVDPTSRVAADVYSFMFLCDFFNFFVILIGYSSFGTQQGDVSSYLEDNRVPVLFLLMLILQFMLIIIDRGIFLRKNILGKIIFQYIQIFLLHIWLFILFPIITGGQFNSVIPPQIYYMVKCFYLLLSAYQVRCGYPTRILGNFLCKGYNYVNMFLFKGFMLIPFLFELRTVMDWMWTDTSMTVFDWIKMEDIFAHIFQLKCTRHAEDEYPQPRGEKKKPFIKYLMGGGILAVIIGIIWFPLVFFSLGNAVGQPNIPYDITLEIRIGPYEPVYQMSAQSNSIYTFTESDLQKLLEVYKEDKAAVTFISNYEAFDIGAVKLSTDSANIWSISPPDRKRMVSEVNSTNPLTVRLEYKVSHKTSKPEDSGVVPDNVEITVPASNANKTNPIRENLLEMLTGNNVPAVQLQYLLPKFLKVTNRGTAKAINQLMIPDPIQSARSFRNISLNLQRPAMSNGSLEKEWWEIHENCSDINFRKYLHFIPYSDCENSIILYTFNDKVFPATLNIITGGGIIGLYALYFFVLSSFVRKGVSDKITRMWISEIPYPDRVYNLIQQIYFARRLRDFALEEDLYSKLVFLMRSPETLIKFTRPPH